LNNPVQTNGEKDLAKRIIIVEKFSLRMDRKVDVKVGELCYKCEERRYNASRSEGN